MDKTKLFDSAEKAIQKGQYEKAIEYLESILKSDPVDLKALNRCADLYLKKQNYATALDYLKRVGQVYTKDGFYSKAVAIYKRVLKIDQGVTKPQLIEIHDHLANLYGQLGLVSDAMTHFQIVVDFYDQTGDQESLLKVLKKVSDLDPYNIDSQLKLAELFVAEKKLESANEALTQLEQNIQTRGHLPDLVRVNERWVDFFPENLERLAQLVHLYLRASEPKKALARVQMAFKRDPRNAQVLELLSATFIELKQPEKAKTVDVELIKIYRADGDAIRLKEVEARHQSTKFASESQIQKLSSSTVTRKTAIPADHAEQSETDNLINSVELSPDERKTISECDVYIKYGLPEKAYEVLSSRLAQFPQSLAIRWKLKVTASELQKKEEVIQFLSEIILLARENNLSLWEQTGTAELKSIDPTHPALLGSKASGNVLVEKSSAPLPPPDVSLTVNAAIPKKTPPTNVQANALSDPDSSEISIVLDDISIESADISEITFFEGDSPKGQLSNKVEKEIVSSIELNDRSASESAPLTLGEESSDVIPLSVADQDSESILELNSISDPAFDLQQGLEEVAFFKSQGLTTEAENLLKSLKTKYPNHKNWNLPPAPSPQQTAQHSASESSLKKKTLDVETLGRNMKLTVQEDERADEDFIDLGAEISRELDAMPATASKPQEASEVKEVFQAFKKGVASSVSKEDWETHFDLGIAYREMNLLEDALEEFKIVAQHANKKVLALYQMGLCEAARDNFSQAKIYFDEALNQPDLMNQEKISVTYDLAEILLKLNDTHRAKELFAEVAQLDPNFREIKDKMKLIG